LSKAEDFLDGGADGGMIFGTIIMDLYMVIPILCDWEEEVVAIRKGHTTEPIENK
jgi:hypothetical protein